MRPRPNPDDEEDDGRPYQYTPTWEIWVDYSPDHRRSDSGYELLDTTTGLRFFLPVRGLGFLIIDTEFDLSPANPKGRLACRGASLLEKAQFEYSPRL